MWMTEKWRVTKVKGDKSEGFWESKLYIGAMNNI